MNDKEKKEEIKSRSMKKSNYGTILLLCAIVVILLAILCAHLKQIDWESDHITLILSFVGILATFVVVSNYVQVNEVERKFSNTEQKINSEINKLSNKINENARDFNDKLEKQNQKIIDNTIKCEAKILSKIANEHMGNKNWNRAFDQLFIALEKSDSIKDRDSVDRILDQMTNLLYFANDSCHSLVVSEYVKKRMMEIDNPKIEEIANLLKLNESITLSK